MPDKLPRSREPSQEDQVEAVAEAFAGSDSEYAGQLVDRLGHGGRQPSECGQSSFCLRQQSAPGCGQLDPAGGAIEQLRAELTLQSGDVLAHCGLPDVQV